MSQGSSLKEPFCMDHAKTLLKFRQFQNEFMKSTFLPKYEQKIVKISALTTQGRNPDDDFINSF